MSPLAIQWHGLLVKPTLKFTSVDLDCLTVKFPFSSMSVTTYNFQPLLLMAGSRATSKSEVPINTIYLTEIGLSMGISW